MSDVTGMIMLVDDDPTSIQLLTHILNGRGHRTILIRSGLEALEAAEANQPDLILLDINMPRMDGYEVCQRLQANPTTRQIPVIFISARGDVMDKIRAFETGGVDYIAKPFAVREVQARVERQLLLRAQQNELERRRRKSQMYFEQLSRAKDRFINVASHDLRNPLGVIMASVELLRLTEGIGDNPIIQEHLARIERSGSQMLSLISDLLDFARIETEQNLHASRVWIAPFLSECAAEFVQRAAIKQVELRYLPPDDDVQLCLDAEKIKRAVHNLLANAVKFTPEGGKVELRAEIIGSEVVIRVLDTGIGIPEKDLPYIFDAFYHVEANELEDYAGGLSLALVRMIADMHGGRAEAENRSSGGANMSIILPLQSNIPELDCAAL